MPLIELADAPDQLDARGVRHAQVEDDQVEFVEIGVHLRQQLGDALRHHGAVAGGVECGLEPIAHERRVGGDEHGLAL